MRMVLFALSLQVALLAETKKHTIHDYMFDYFHRTEEIEDQRQEEGIESNENLAQSDESQEKSDSE